MNATAGEAASGAARGSASLMIREAVFEDWWECGRICYEAFATVARQHGFPIDFPTIPAAAEPLRGLILNPRNYGVVAEIDGRIVGSSFLDERAAIYAIGPVTVDPTCQNAGVGRALMQAMLDRVTERDALGVRLVQISYHNRSLSLYTKLGFQVRASFAALYGPPIKLAMPGYRVRRATPDDAAACDALCTRVHGFPRVGEIREAIDGRGALVVERLGRITGYTTGVQYWTHSVAETNDDMKALICASPDYGTPGYLVPVDNAELFRWSLEHGLRVFFVTNLMAVGIYQEPQGAYLPSVGY